MVEELSIIQKTYDLIKFYVPIINKLPKEHKFGLGNRMVNNLYDLFDGLLWCKYAKIKLTRLQELNILLNIIRYQTRILQDFNLISLKRYENINKKVDEIGVELGGWINQRRKIEKN